MARHDSLGLPNRVVFREYANQEPGQRARDEGIAVLCLDLDHFKYVNDTFGHATGDALLCAVADRLSSNVRGDDVLVRLGGDEFAVVQVGVDQPSHAMALATRLIETLSHPFDLDGQHVVIGTSVGIAYGLACDANAEALLKNADMALYRAKADGRGTFQFFDTEMNTRAQARHLLEVGLRSALANAEFELFFQPILDVRTCLLNRFEALIRWRRPERGLVGPSEFIPLAEEIGLIVPIGEWVIKEACRVAATWPGTIAVAVNLSAAQLKSSNLVNAVCEALYASGLPASRLELEITETVLLQNTATSVASLRCLRSLGLRIALDDFGTGYSSIGCLRTFPFDRIKIDQSFIRDLGATTDAVPIVAAIIALGHALGMSVTAEGIETAEQFTTLRGAACAEVQGYLFSPPVPSWDVLRIIAQLGPVVRAAA
jgi:diguanylate cyclase (GGDEF)-like protein